MRRSCRGASFFSFKHLRDGAIMVVVLVVMVVMVLVLSRQGGVCIDLFPL